MSADNQIIIKKIKNKWRVTHNFADGGEIEKLGEFNTLEEAADKANEFEKKCNEDGYEVEYGIKIIK